MNASRQPFFVSALLTVLLACACVWRHIAEIASHPAWEIASIVVLAILILALVSQLSIKFAPASSRNYLPLQVFTVVSCSAALPDAAALLTALLVTLAVRQSVFAMQKGLRFESTFRMGFYFGLAALIHAPAAVVAVVVIPTAMMVYKRVWREWVVGIVGLLLPFGLVCFVHWALGMKGFAMEFWESFSTAAGWLSGVTAADAVVGAAGLLLGMVSVVGGLVGRKSVRTLPRRFMSLVSVLFFVSLSSLVVPGAGPMSIPMVGVAAACAVPYGFFGRWERVSTALYAAMLATVFGAAFLPF